MYEYAYEVVNLSEYTRLRCVSEYLVLESTALEAGLPTEPDYYPGVAFALSLYPKCPQPDRVLAICSHTDAGALAVLHQNQVEGVQLLRATSG